MHNICEDGPNTETFNILLQGVSKQKNKKDRAMFLAAEMAALSVKADRLTYDRLILSCFESRRLRDAFRYLEEMILVGQGQETEDGKKGWWMRTGTAKELVRRCVVSKDERAWDLLDEMNRERDGESYVEGWANTKWAEFTTEAKAAVTSGDID